MSAGTKCGERRHIPNLDTSPSTDSAFRVSSGDWYLSRWRRTNRTQPDLSNFFDQPEPPAHSGRSPRSRSPLAGPQPSKIQIVVPLVETLPPPDSFVLFA